MYTYPYIHTREIVYMYSSMESCVIFRLELTAALRDINVWLHPTETTALLATLDKDNNDFVDEAEFVLFWNRTN